MKRGKKAQASIGLSFNMIFSILLIIAFVAIAIYVILHFLNLRKCTEVSMFLSDLQDSVDEVWKASSKSMEYSQPLPTQIKYICFADFERAANNNQEIYDRIKRYEVYDASIYFYPEGKACNMPYYNLKHINVSEITSEQNPYCIENKGKPVLKLSKDFYEALVCIGDDCASGSSSSVSLQVCNKAQAENTCGWIDTTYWTGYRQECCSKYSLCC